MKTEAPVAPGFSQRLADVVELGKLRLTLLVLVTVVVGYWAAVFSDAATIAKPGVFWATLAGVLLTAAGGAALNQVLEREFDARMERTKDRPLAAGRMNADIALVLAALVTLAGVALLDRAVGRLPALLAALSALIYVAAYTPLKRLTTLNTFVGAITGALPPMIGWAAAAEQLDPGAWLLFGILFVWQVPHFLAIAWLYRDDYERGGYRMLGVGDESGEFTTLQIVMFCLVLLPVSLMPTLIGIAGQLYFFTALALGIGMLVLGLRLIRSRTREEARRLFFGSLVYLPCLLGMLLWDSKGA